MKSKIEGFFRIQIIQDFDILFFLIDPLIPQNCWYWMANKTLKHKNVYKRRKLKPKEMTFESKEREGKRKKSKCRRKNLKGCLGYVLGWGGVGKNL